jgi:hypothetical protein
LTTAVSATVIATATTSYANASALKPNALVLCTCCNSIKTLLLRFIYIAATACDTPTLPTALQKRLHRTLPLANLKYVETQLQAYLAPTTTEIQQQKTHVRVCISIVHPAASY